jgi:hypothetical protein
VGAGSCRTSYGHREQKKETKLKKLILILGLALPWTAFADVTFYDQYGIPVGSAQQSVDGWTYKDQYGIQSGSARPNYSGGWTFYNRYGIPVGSQDGQ